MTWLVGAISIWWDALLSLDAGGWVLVLAQLNMSGFVDSPWEVLPFLKSGWRNTLGEGGDRRSRGRENCGWYIK